MIAVGMMSGTSVDGIDIAAIDIDGDDIKVLSTAHRDYDDELRKRILKAASGEALGAADFAAMHVAIGDAYADTVVDLLRFSIYILMAAVLVQAVLSWFHTYTPLASVLDVAGPEVVVVLRKRGLQVAEGQPISGELGGMIKSIPQLVESKFPG